VYREANAPNAEDRPRSPLPQGHSYNQVLVDMAKPNLLRPYPVSPIYNDVVGYFNAAATKARNGEPVVDALAEAQRQAEQKDRELKAQRPGW
jgi:hypothetical protein